MTNFSKAICLKDIDFEYFFGFEKYFGLSIFGFRTSLVAIKKYIKYGFLGDGS